ncbi:MAG: hypothetical protein ACI83N_001161 [Hydrogenophaga sp.]
MSAKGTAGPFNWLNKPRAGAKDKNEMVHRAPFLIIEKSDEVSEIFSI